MALTKIENLINPEVMADMISAKIPDKIVVTPFAKIDTTLQGQAGDTITVPKFAYIGDAEDVAEGAACPTNQLTATTAQYTVKKAMKAVELTDEAVLSGYGNPVGEANNQLAKSVASKIDNDALDALMDATTVYDGSAAQISYSGVVMGVDKFNEEIQTDKVMFVAPAQVTTLRLDSDFISADKYGQGTNVMMRGEIGMIAGVRIVPSRKVKARDAVSEVKGVYTINLSGTATDGDIITVNGKTLYTADDADVAADVATALATAIGADDDLKAVFTAAASGATVALTQKAGGVGAMPTVSVSTGATIGAGIVQTTAGVAAKAAGFVNPIVQLTVDAETEDETPALTIYMKRGVNVETERHSNKRTTEISIDEMYTVALTDVSKVVLAVFGVAAG